MAGVGALLSTAAGPNRQTVQVSPNTWKYWDCTLRLYVDIWSKCAASRSPHLPEIQNRVRNAISGLPPREQKVISLYYYAEATMKEIGAEIGVNESRVSQLHARAIKRLRESLGELGPQHVTAMREALVEMATARPLMAKATLKAPKVRGMKPAMPLDYAAAAKARAARPPQIKVALRPRMREAIAVAR